MAEGATRKADTRQRVVKAAAAALRTHGPEGVGVAAIMREAGLTHGGFYAHFPSKDALVAEAVEDMLGGGGDTFARLTQGRAGRAALELFVDAYVSRRHRDAPELGCPMAVMAAEVARQPEPVRRALSVGYARLVDRIAEHLPPDGSPDGDALSCDTLARDTLARSLLAEMAGAVALARATADTEESDRILLASRRAVKARLPADPLPEPISA